MAIQPTELQTQRTLLGPFRQGREGLHRSDLISHGERRNSVVFGVLRDEWKELRANR